MIEEGTNVYVNHCIYINSMGGRSVDSIYFIQKILFATSAISRRTHFTRNRFD